MHSINLAVEKINPLIPHTAELIVGFIAFTLLYLYDFVLMALSPQDIVRTL